MRSYRDWVVETSSTTGTGTYSLSGSPPAGTSYFTFRQRYSNGETKLVYWVFNQDRTKWEKNRFGTLTYGSPDTLSRNVVESTNGDAPVSWTGGDGPLRIVVVADSDAQEFAISMGLGTSRPGVLKFGPWADQDDVASGIHTLKLFDGVSDIVLGIINAAAHSFIPVFNFSPGHIKGTYANAAGDATNDIDISAGSALDSTDTYPMRWSAMTKRLDADWAVGDGNGGRDTGSLANGEWYIHVIARSDTGVVDALFSTSPTAPTMPANYDHFRLYGWFRRSGGSITAFKTYELPGGGIDFQWNSKPTDLSLSGQTFTTRRTDAISAPTGFSTIAHVVVAMTHASGAGTVTSTVSNPEVASADDVTLTLQANGVQTVSEVHPRLSAAGLLGSKSNTATLGGYTVRTHGFKWSRR